MDLFDPTQMALGAAMTGATARQAALAGNLANVDTPGYVRKDVDFHSALRAALAGAASPDSVQFSAQDDTSAPMRVDGNTVDVDSESSKLAQNALEYQSLAQVSAARIDILQNAMGVK